MAAPAQIITTGTILARTDFSEADRIITVLTSDKGKIKAIAKGVRRPKSKLAGGIELFSISNFTFLPRRGDLQTLVSSRLIEHYGNIVKDIERTMLGYELLKRVNRVTEDAANEEYFEMLKYTLTGLNDDSVSKELVELWFTMQLLKLTGHSPNLRTDTLGAALEAEQNYIFSFDDMAFVPNSNGPHKANVIKLLRLGIGATDPTIFSQVKGAEKLVDTALQLAKAMLKYSVRV
jgi:DNA repair protein RecO (recombination protein O)